MTQPLRVLTVSPDTDLREAVAQTLTEQGHTCQWVADAEQAAAELAERRHDAVLVDSGLADESAAGVCTSIQSLGKESPSLFILLREESGTPLQTYRSLGVRDFLPVPLHRELLRLRLDELETIQGSTESTGFISREAFFSETSKRIPTTRNSGRNLALLSLTLHCGDSEFDWVGLEPQARGGIERLLVEAMQATFAAEIDLEGLGVHPKDVCMSWARSDRVLVLVPGLRRVQDAAKLATRFQDRIVRHSQVAASSVALSSSLGIAACPEDGVDAVVLANAAQAAADRARENGRDCMAFHTHAMGQWAFERLTLETSLASALENQELRVFYQPRVDIRSRKILGMEALVRWIHPKLGMVSPAQFIPLAEETGLITPIGEWVLAEACRQNRVWRDAGLAPVRVSVNLSPVQFRDPNLHQVVVDCLQRSGLDEDGLELEVTESMLMNDPKVTISTLSKLKEAGLKISIDDFGTGYSSLSYLKQFPIDSLKIDRSFVRDVTTNPDDAAIATAIILMGHSLKLNVVAEGVETESQLAFLRVLQCNEIQGYLFSPPVPADKAAELLSASILSA